MNTAIKTEPVFRHTIGGDICHTERTFDIGGQLICDAHDRRVVQECTHPDDQLVTEERRNAAPFPLNYGERTTTCGACNSIVSRVQIGATRR